jgi:hypothetical protein
MISLLIAPNKRTWIFIGCCMAFPQVIHSSAGAQPPNPAVEKLAAENGLVGYDHSKQVQKKLLEFVKPIYKEPLVSSQMIVGLSKIDDKEKVSEARQKAADRISLAATSMAELELNQRMSEQFTKLYVLRSQGGPGAGMRQLGAAIKSSANVMKNKAKIEELESDLELLKARAAIAFETQKAKAEIRLQGVKEREINPVVAALGNGLNVLLDAMSSTLGASALEGLNPELVKLIDRQKIADYDLSKIQLRIDGEAGPLIFSAAEGSGSPGIPPARMQHPSLYPFVKEIESTFEELRSTSLSRPLIEVIDDLTRKLDELDAKTDEVLGSAHDNAKKGHVQHRSYQQTKEYRARLRALVNRMLLEGNTNTVRSPQGKFDPQQYGDRVVDFAIFAIENGCKFAPAKEGDGVVYARLQRALLELQQILDVRNELQAMQAAPPK